MKATKSEQRQIKTAKEILMRHASNAKDGFMAGQMKWILEAMYEYAKEEKDMAYDMGYKDGSRDGMAHEHKVAMQEIEKYSNEGDRPFGVHP